ncbi:MAG: DNA-directed RNA polymerase subunit omega [Phascolarctobacterium sp.]|nr:DNA-directed RNA polymerase subunit omega [Phascolarctobacterium sp.]
MSMVSPSANFLTTKVDNKYTLVILAAKMARELTCSCVNASSKEVSTALEEIAEGRITYSRENR